MTRESLSKTQSMRRAVAILLAAALLTGLVGCSAGPGESDSAAADRPRAGAVSRDSAIMEEGGRRMQPRQLLLPEGDVKLGGLAPAGEALFAWGMTEDGDSRFFLLHPDSGRAETLSELSAAAVETIDAAEDGSCHVLTLDETGAYTILSRMPDGRTEQIALAPELTEDSAVYRFMVTEAGCLVLTHSGLWACDRSGAAPRLLDEYSRGTDLIRLPGGRAYYVRFAGDTPDPTRLEQEKRTELIEVEADLSLGGRYGVDALFRSFLADPAGQLYAIQGDIVYRYDPRTAEAAPLVNLRLSGIEAWSLVCVREDCFASLDRGMPLLWRAAEDDAQLLRLATYRISLRLSYVVDLFNRSDQGYLIEVVDYAAYDDFSAPGAGLDRYAQDMLAGVTPDIYDLEYFYPAKYAASGLLQDLSPFFEGEETLALDDLSPGVRKALMFRGGLYELAPLYELVTLCSAPQTVGQSLSAAELAELAEREGCRRLFGDDLTRKEFLNYVLAFMKDELYSEESARCDFSNRDFLTLLTLAAGLPDETGPDNGIDIGRLAAGEQLLSLAFLGNGTVRDLAIYDAALGGQAAYVGFPSGDGTGFGCLPLIRLGMAADSEKQEAVWAFFRFLLSEEIQDQMDLLQGIPVLASAQQRQMEKWISVMVEDGPLGVYAPAREGTVQFRGEYDLEHGNERVLTMLDRIDCVAACDPAILEIVLDCAAPFFAGDKTAEQAVGQIQSRVSIYLAEQYG